MKKIYLIAYDITSDKRRNKMAELLEAHGLRINLSVFECTLTPVQYDNVFRQINELIDRKTDTVKIYPLTREVYARSITVGRKSQGPGYTVFVD